MLSSLQIDNYALIDSVKAFFSDGMTCITGQTGAGKSILLGGLSLVLGKRADSTMIKDPAKKCIVEATFELKDDELKDYFEKKNLQYDSQTIIRREIYPNGKSRVFINDSPVLLSVLEEIGLRLIDLHSQRKTQTLMREDQQLSIVDSFAKNSNLLSKYQEVLFRFKEILKKKERLTKENFLDEESKELNQYLFEELQEADLTHSLKNDLESELQELTHFEDIKTALQSAIHTLEDEPYGLIQLMFKLQGFFDKLIQNTNRFQYLSERVSALRAETQDLSFELNTAFDSLEVNDQEIEQLTQQLNHLNQLELKHRVQSIEQLIEKRDQLEKFLTDVETLNNQLIEIELQEEKYQSELKRLGDQLSKKRKEKSIQLIKEIEELTSQMGMPDMEMKMVFSPADTFTINGIDNLDFLIKTNPGSDFKPLKKVASGGELSRIMLALKTVVSRYKKLPTVVFDEIDTGISGKIADAVAQVMRTLSSQMQVITVTHLPQVAAAGKHHFKVLKEIKGETTKTVLKKLDSDQRVQEIASMLSSHQITSSALNHAQVLLINNINEDES